VLGRTTSFSGRLTFVESLKIDGRFEGNIDSTGFLYVEEGAELHVQALKAARVVVAGTVRGDIIAADSVDLLPSARVYGNIRTQKLRIADGVIFEGRCEMIKSADSFNPFTAQRPGEGP
jgi:cytoskeletal protein CcmA (bactofilin family)